MEASSQDISSFALSPEDDALLDKGTLFVNSATEGSTSVRTNFLNECPSLLFSCHKPSNQIAFCFAAEAGRVDILKLLVSHKGGDDADTNTSTHVHPTLASSIDQRGCLF